MLKLPSRFLLFAACALALAGAAATALAQAPGTPQLAGVQFTLKLRENFQIPAPQEPGTVQPVLTPAPVAPGFIVLKDDPNIPNNEFRNWSDIIYFDFQDPAHRRVFFLSDPHGRTWQDSDLTPYGVSLTQIIGDPRSVYLPELYPVTQYVAGGQPGAGIATYLAYSDIDTLPPGTPITSLGGQPFSFDLREQCGEQVPEPIVVRDLPFRVQPGFLVLTEVDPTNETIAQDNSKWSDVVYFRPAAGGGPATQAVLISDSRPAGTPERGIVDSDLSPVGLHVYDVLEGNTVYKKEALPTLYAATDPAGVAANYRVFSDAEGLIISVIDWTTLGNVVRFRFRAENPDPNCPSERTQLTASSQVFGVFNPNYGPIGQADIPSLLPAGQQDSFFDVFFDVDLSMLPPSAMTTMDMTPFTGPGGTAARPAAFQIASAGCPPDDHWNGNVDIVWNDPAGGGGHVNKHFGTLQVCPGHGNSYIHVITGCSGTSTVTINVPSSCTGFTVKLVNNDKTPAPSPLPPGWDGLICVSADASVPFGTTCCFTVDVVCGGQTATIDMCATTCDWSVNPPGTPTDPALQFSVNLREDFHIPASRQEQAQVVQLPPVEPGFVVLKDIPTLSNQDPQGWSDIVAFQPNPAGSRALFLSDPPGGHFTDADLAPYGLSIAQIVGGNAVYLAEGRVTRYVAEHGTTKGSATYFIYSDVDTLLPGTPLQGQSFSAELSEPPDPNEVIVHVNLPAPVQPGFVVLLDDSTSANDAALEDTTKWSDIVFYPPAAGAPPQAILISDRGNAAGVENGMNSTDLEPLGLSIFDVLEGNTIYLKEKVPTIYRPANATAGAVARYAIFSDASESGVPRSGTGAFGIRSIIPNPTLASARIDFSIPKAGRIRIDIYDLAGQRVSTPADGRWSAGPHSVVWSGRRDDGRALRSGGYFAKLAWEGKTATRMVFMVK